MSQSDCRWRRHRIIRVAVSVVVTSALAAAYVGADIADVLPGLLTHQAVHIPHYAHPRSIRSATASVSGVARHVPIDTQAADRLIDQLSKTAQLGSDFSVAIVDDQGGAVAGHEAQIPREPASTLKTLTALAAASVLDMGSTLSTGTFLTQTSGDGAVVTLKGSGDMLLGAGDSDPEHVNGRAGLATLADATATALQQRGIGAVTLNYDDSLFGSERSPSHIAQNNSGNQFFTPISSMAVDGGRQWSGSSPSDPDIFTSYPPLSMQTAKDTAQRFAELLTRRGIAIRGDVSSGKAPSGTSPLTSVQSATLGEIMAFMLRHSDNTLAEEFGRLLALHSGEQNTPSGAVDAVKNTLGALGLDLGGLTMADCAGLSPGSQVTVKTLAQVQAHNLQAGSGAAAAEGLSIPGALGTALDRLDDPQAAGLLRVKTGSLDAVTSMAGNVSRLKGGTLAFAVVVNNPENMESARQDIDVFVAQLVKL